MHGSRSRRSSFWAGFPMTTHLFNPMVDPRGGEGRWESLSSSSLIETPPYSKPQAFIENYDRKRPKPHVEPMPKFEGVARLCLQTPAIPSDPVAAVTSAFIDARELLNANDIGAEDRDFEDDFGAYWRHYLPADFREAKLHGMSRVAAGYRDGSYYCFPDKVSIRRWHADLMGGAYVRDPLRCPIIELTRIPKPDRYPGDRP
jgi:hypothetical protein